MKTTTQPFTTRRRRYGFSLIELLVVMAIISLLAAVATPAFQGVQEAAKQNAAMQNARQIGLGMKMYAMDTNGAFPTGTNRFGEAIATSNDAFRDMLDYVDNDERIFMVAGSAYGPSADSQVSTPAEMVEPGENHFAYIDGLTTSSSSAWPLIVDGTDGSGTYGDQIGTPGGLWRGKKAIVIRVDGSAKTVRLGGAGGARFIPRLDDPTANALDTASYMGAAQLLDPAQ